jgi:Family of unknown function (DUF5906)
MRRQDTKPQGADHPVDIADAKLQVTIFADEAALSFTTKNISLWDLRDHILTTAAGHKAQLPWLKLAEFGDIKTYKGCLRHNANVIAINGVEGDYDGGAMGYDAAIALLKQAGICFLIYTSPSHTPDVPRWRVLAPTSTALAPSEHDKLVARLNGVLGGILANESFTLSQSYYYGKVTGNTHHRCDYCVGDYIDQRQDLDAGVRYRAARSRIDNIELTDVPGVGPEEPITSLDDVRLNLWPDLRHMIVTATPPPTAPRLKGGRGHCYVVYWLVKRGLSNAQIKQAYLLGRIKDGPRRCSRGFDGYLERTIAFCRSSYVREAQQRAEQVAKNIEIGNDITEPILPTIMTLAEMRERLVFIGSSGAVVDRLTGRIRKKEAAASEYAASRYIYRPPGAREDKDVPALKFWIGSRGRITVDVLAWVPGEPQICRPPESTDGSRTAFNSWRGITPMSAPEDWEARVVPFMEHVEFLVPVEGERGRFLNWLAHILQHPEVLPHTMYLMITQTTGIGRNLLASMIVRTLRGHVAAGVSLPELLDGTFTGRLSEKLLAIVDEAKEGSGERRYQRGQTLKRLITEEHRHINRKYGLQSVEKNCCRWLMLSNHLDAIPFDNTDRRVIVIANPTKRKESAYYERMFGLLDDHNFIASVRRLLETRDISRFRPGDHAPMNEAKQEALAGMMSETERVIAEFKEDCPAELTSRTIIRNYVNGTLGTMVNESHLTHAINRAGMINTGKRVEMADGDRQSVVIVKGNWTRQSVDATLPPQLVSIIERSKPVRWN